MTAFSTATISITTENYHTKVWVELDAPLVNGKPDRSAGIVHIDVAPLVEAGKTPIQFGLSVMLEPFRVEGAKTPLGAAFCETRYEHADTLSSKPGDASLVWYHWNTANHSSYQTDTMVGQGMGRPSAAAGALPDLFSHRAFGAIKNRSREEEVGIVENSTARCRRGHGDACRTGCTHWLR